VKTTYSCYCGFVYCRYGTDKCEGDLFHYSKVEEYGQVWEQKLRDLWGQPISLNRITKILGIGSSDTLKRQVIRLGLSLARKGKKFMYASIGLFIKG
jgi:hypothetical protein